jgi:hypothetical protein
MRSGPDPYPVASGDERQVGSVYREPHAAPAGLRSAGLFCLLLGRAAIGHRIRAPRLAAHASTWIVPASPLAGFGSVVCTSQTLRPCAVRWRPVAGRPPRRGWGSVDEGENRGESARAARASRTARRASRCLRCRRGSHSRPDVLDTRYWSSDRLRVRSVPLESTLRAGGSPTVREHQRRHRRRGVLDSGSGALARQD